MHSQEPQKPVVIKHKVGWLGVVMGSLGTVLLLLLVVSVMATR